jgi:hypothetical protein
MHDLSMEVARRPVSAVSRRLLRWARRRPTAGASAEEALDVKQFNWQAATLIGISVVLTGCAQPGSTVDRKDKPAQVVRIEGTDLNRLILTPQAAERLGIKTEPVREVPAPGSGPGGGGARSTAIPTAAVVYDKNGGTWAYTTVEPLNYVRQRVASARIEGDLAILQSGPPPGTQVVTVGAAELLGAEYGVEGE